MTSPDKSAHYISVSSAVESTQDAIYLAVINKDDIKSKRLIEFLTLLLRMLIGRRI